MRIRLTEPEVLRVEAPSATSAGCGQLNLCPPREPSPILQWPCKLDIQREFN